MHIACSTMSTATKNADEVYKVVIVHNKNKMAIPKVENLLQEQPKGDNSFK